jgi:hypothetical protein
MHRKRWQKCGRRNVYDTIRRGGHVVRGSPKGETIDIDVM